MNHYPSYLQNKENFLPHSTSFHYFSFHYFLSQNFLNQLNCSNSPPHISSTTLTYSRLCLTAAATMFLPKSSGTSSKLLFLDLSQRRLTQDTFPFLKHMILKVLSDSAAFLPIILAGCSLLGLLSGISSLFHS